MTRWFKGALILPERVVPNGLLRVEGGQITGLWDLETTAAPAHDPRATTTVSGYLAPGFIDLHVHGGGGDFMDCDPEAVAAITQTHARYGTTGLLATTLTAPEERIIAAIRAAKAAPRRGARVLGFHIEGPFVNPKLKGAQDGRYVRLASTAEIDRWMAEGEAGDRWHVTMAPEMEGATAAVQHLAGRGAIVSAGHTDCTYAQLAAAQAAGVRHVTHLYNAMRGLHHREPGTVGGALTLPGLTVELIADGVHVHPASMAVAVGARGADGVLLVTDAMRAAGMGEGEYLLGELKAVVRNGEARLADGTLAGSVLTMADAVRNMVKLVGVPLPAAVAMASRNPARRHGLEARKGALAVGMDADLVLLDQDLRVQATVVAGQAVFGAEVIQG
ncbi:MAG: N-acetylglucosamine-6-phosphate deacetylase [Firmicutes bacterium]|nr:N-acetylglucosamine-6-phosphate deacetylase [Bacillota bacterium]